MENKYEKVKAIMPGMMFSALQPDGTIDTTPSFGLSEDNNIIILCGIVKKRGFITFEDTDRLNECGKIVNATGIHIQKNSNDDLLVELYYRVTPAEIIEQELKNLEIRTDRLKAIIPVLKMLPNAEYKGGGHVWVNEIPEESIAYKVDEHTVTLKDGTTWKNASRVGAANAGWVFFSVPSKEV